MLRTQIYLTESEGRSLRAMAQHTGKTQSRLIREAVDLYITSFGTEEKSETLRKACGLWKHRSDLPDFRKLRKEWDKRIPGSK